MKAVPVFVLLLPSLQTSLFGLYCTLFVLDLNLVELLRSSVISLSEREVGATADVFQMALRCRDTNLRPDPPSGLSFGTV